MVILDREEDLVQRGIKEAICERVEKPSLNLKGGLRYNLLSTWDRALSQLPRRLSRDQLGHVTITNLMKAVDYGCNFVSVANIFFISSK